MASRELAWRRSLLPAALPLGGLKQQPQQCIIMSITMSSIIVAIIMSGIMPAITDGITTYGTTGSRQP